MFLEPPSDFDCWQAGWMGYLHTSRCSLERGNSNPHFLNTVYMITSPIHDENESQLVDEKNESGLNVAVTVVDAVDIGLENPAAESADQESPILDEQSQAVTAPFVGQWNKLVSQTNWEKGKIITDWRDALIASGAPVSSYSDETWSKQVGGVTSQHVGRLRRVHERFGGSQGSYTGLYWSHFLAALDWDDAELWLEGAVRSDWSVSQMRKMRWETAGSDPKHAPKDEELITSEVDGDFDQLVEEPEVESDRENDDRISASGPLAEGPDFGEEDLGSDGEAAVGVQSEDVAWSDADNESDMGNPFAGLPDLPPDVADALEQFKLCIVRHRASQWGDMSQKTMLDVLGALQQFAMR